MIITPRTHDGRPNKNTIPGQEGTRQEKNYYYRQWLDRFKQNTKRKHEIDIGPLNKEDPKTGSAEWNTQEEKIQQGFLSALRPEATQQITRIEYRTEPDKNKIVKLLKLYNRYYLPKRDEYNSRGDFFRAKQRDTETPESNLEKLLELEKECNFPEFSTKLPISKFITSITYRKLRDKLLKEKYLDIPKVVEQIQQNTYDRKNKKNTIPEALTSNPEKDIKEEPIHKITYTEQHGTRSEERHKDQNGGYCDALNWNPNHKCPARYVICHKCKKKGHFAEVCRLDQKTTRI